MSITAGTISQSAVSQNSVTLVATAATGGTAPYTYQWYRSTVSGFTPGGGNIISGATSLTLVDSGLIPNTTYFYKLVATDAVPASVTYTQQTVVTSIPVPNPNQFALTSQLGVIDMRFPFNTVSVQIDASQATALYAGSAVKMVDSADGVPKVVGCAADSDEVLGFINFDIKSISFLAGDRAEISMSGNVIYLYATGAIARGAQVCLDLSTNGGVSALVTGNKIVGWAFDKAPAAGALIRVFLKSPSFTVAP